MSRRARRLIAPRRRRMPEADADADEDDLADDAKDDDDIDNDDDDDGSSVQKPLRKLKRRRLDRKDGVSVPSLYTRWPKKVSHYQEASFNCIENRQCGYIFTNFEYKMSTITF